MTSYDLNIPQGSDFNISLNLTDSSNAPLNLSGYNISGYVKMKISDTGLLINLNPSISNAISGVISIFVPASGLGTGIPITIANYDIFIGNGTSTQKVLYGRAYIYPEVTY